MGPHFLSGHMGSSAGASTAGAVLAFLGQSRAQWPMPPQRKHLLVASSTPSTGVSSSERVNVLGAGRFFSFASKSAAAASAAA